MYSTIIVDNFFPDPKVVLSFCEKIIKWDNPNENENWPGVRSSNFIDINPDLHKYILHNILKMYFGNDYKVEIGRSEMRFHKIKYEDWLSHEKKETRIHQDPSDLAGVIYLNENINDENTGTTLYDNNKQSLIKISNNFNTLACYDGKRYHGLTGLDKKERLVIVIFLTNLTVKV
tara:strand:+ start:170 stop:694 length:525 start_codon:yes stop_codon:yes gene_type:complete